MDEKVKAEVCDKGKKLDEMLVSNAMLVLGAVEQVVGRELDDKEKKLIIDSAKAFHMISMLTARSVLG